VILPRAGSRRALSVFRNFDRAFIAQSVDVPDRATAVPRRPIPALESPANTCAVGRLEALNPPHPEQREAMPHPHLARTFVSAASNFVGRSRCGEMEQPNTHLSRARVSGRQIMSYTFGARE
jgi:hypothetical protein